MTEHPRRKTEHRRRKMVRLTAVLAMFALFATGCEFNYILMSSTPDPATGATVGNGRSWAPSVSGDGRYTVFLSDASNLVVGDTNGTTDVFVRDNATQQVFRYTNGVVDSLSNPTISSDGSRIAYTVNLTYNGAFRSTLAVVNRYSATVAFTEVAPYVAVSYQNPSLSRDGKAVAWEYHAPTYQTIRFDASGGTLAPKLPPRTNGVQSGSAYRPKVDSAGSEILFDSKESNFVTGDTNGVSDVFNWAVSNYYVPVNTVRRVSYTSSGAQGNGDSAYASWLYFGDILHTDPYEEVMYASFASNLVSGDGNGHQDIFNANTALPGNHVYRTVDRPISGNGDSSLPTASADSRFVSFVSKATDLVPNDTNSASDVFVLDRIQSQRAAIWRASVSYPLIEASGASTAPQISADGRWVSYQSDAPDLRNEDTNGVTDVFTSFAGKVTVTSMSPSVFTRGVTNYPVVIRGVGFSSAPHVSVIDNQATFTNVHLVDDRTITANITVAPTAHPDETLQIGIVGTPITSSDASASSCACMTTVP